jgi:hypothetical protein
MSLRNVLIAALFMPLLSVSQPAVSDFDAAKVVGPDECGECHKNEVSVWRETRHQKTFYDLPRKQEAQDIAERMGVRRLRQDAVCSDCHFTLKAEAGGHEAIAGISCETCHSPARDWLDVHSDYGGKDVEKADETPEHRRNRIARMDAEGMMRPNDIYALAANCYQCHLVLNEELVNKGEHKAGSDFELVSWSQGENRHNFNRSADGRENVESSIERRRLMFVAGMALDLEYSLRAVARATERATFAVENAQRAALNIRKLQAVNEILNNAELAEMLRIAGGVELRLNNGPALNEAADVVGVQTRRFLDTHDGSAFAVLDQYVPGVDRYKGQPGLAQH